MRFSWLILVCLLFPVIALAQIDVTGRIIREDTKTPVAGANVFLSNSSFGGATNNNGTFELHNVRPGEYTLVVTLIGYADYTTSILVSNAPIHLNIELKPKSIMLREVQISDNAKAEWRRNYEQFKKEFIGTDENAKNCEVMNPEILDFTYHKTQKVLEAYADEFLVVENRALGYRVKFLVKDFRSDHISGIISYSGQRLFELLPGKEAQKKKWSIARNYTYYGSAMHFYRSLYKDRLAEEGFEMHRFTRFLNRERPPEEDIQHHIDYFIKINRRDSANKWINYENMSKYAHEILYNEQSFNISTCKRTDQPGIFALTFPDCLYVIYTKKREETVFRDVYRPLTMPNYEITVLSFMGKENYALFDMNGIIVGGGPLNEGTWSKSRLSELLPIDYVPTDEVDNTLKDFDSKKH
jgi:hypothetical protein